MIRLQSRDHEILRTLSLKVRLLSLEQAASTWWTAEDSGRSLARRRLGKCIEAGMLTRLRPMVRPLPGISDPVITWEPGSPSPNCAEIAWKLESRWTEPPEQTTVYLATPRCANQFGGRSRGKLTHDYQATHDLGVSAVYLHLLQSDPDAAEQWVGEDLLRQRLGRGKRPDAVLTDGPGGAIRLIVEFGGAYDVTRVRNFHEHWAREGLPYQLW